MIRAIFALAFALSCGGVCLAEGYTFSNGYYWLSGKAYSRSQHYQQPYWYNGCYHQGYNYYKYEPVNVTPAAAIDYRNPNWRSDLLGLLAQRDKIVGAERLAHAEQQYFLQAMKFAGLEGNFRIENYGVYPYHNSGLQLTQNGVLGNTVYAYKYTDVATLFGDNDPQQLYQMASRLAESSQRYAGDGTQAFMGLVEQNAANRLKAAEILARGQAAAQTLKALTENSVTVSKTSEGKITTPASPTSPASSPLKAKRDAIIKTKCAACHDAKKNSGGYNLLEYDSYDDSKRLAVFNSLTNPDPNKMMPRSPTGGAGERLANDEIAAFLEPKERR